MATGSTSAADLYLHKEIFSCAWEKSRGGKASLLMTPGLVLLVHGHTPLPLFSFPQSPLPACFQASPQPSLIVLLSACSFCSRASSQSQPSTLAAPAPVESLRQCRCSCCLV